MNVVRNALDRVGGPAAVTWWAFCLSFADRLVASGVPIGIVAPSPLAVRILCTAASSLIMFLPLMLLWVVQHLHPRSRPALTIAAFVVAAVLRGWSLDFFLHVFAGEPAVAAQRIARGFYPTILIFVVCAAVSNTLHQRKLETAHLTDVQEQLATARARAEFSVQERNEALIHQVRKVLENEMSALDGSRPQEALLSLRRTATDVVRPLSHQLAMTFSEHEVPIVSPQSKNLGLRDVVSGAVTGKAFRPVLTALALSGSWISVTIVVPGLGLRFLSSLLIIGLLLGIGNVFLRRVLPTMGPRNQFLLVIVTALTAGVMTAAYIRLVVGEFGWTSTIAQCVIFYVTVVAAVIAFANNVLQSRANLLLETRNATDALRRQLVLTRQLAWFHQRALSRALHGPVQSTVTAAALRLDDHVNEGTLTGDVVEGVRHELLLSLDVLHAPDNEVAPLDMGIARIAGTWEGLCEVVSNVVPDAELALRNDAIARACVLDILTDGVSNSVRHGKAHRICIRVEQQGNSILLEIIDDGSQGILDAKKGLGTALLDECTLEWTLTDSTPGHRLVASLPIE